MKKKRKKKSLYQKSLIAFFCILLILSEIFIVYVAYSLREYDNNNIDTYMKNLILDITKEVKNNNAEKYFLVNELNSSYEEKSSLNKGYKELFSNNKISYNKNDNQNNTYDLYAGDKLICTITLDVSKKVNVLGILKYNVLEIENIKTYTEDGLYKVEALVPNGYKLYVNDKLVTEDNIVSTTMLSGYEELSLDSLKVNHYLVTNLSYTPEVSIIDSNNKEFDYNYENGIYNATVVTTLNSYEELSNVLKVDYNPVNLIENYSLFTTKDLDGTLYGFYQISPYLVENTILYNKAYSWVTGIDAAYMETHTLDNPIFSKEEFTNYIVYNEYTFSVEVHLEKILHTNSGNQTDSLNARMYFTYYDGIYHLVSMESL